MADAACQGSDVEIDTPTVAAGRHSVEPFSKPIEIAKNSESEGEEEENSH